MLKLFSCLWARTDRNQYGRRTYAVLDAHEMNVVKIKTQYCVRQFVLTANSAMSTFHGIYFRFAMVNDMSNEHMNTIH